MLTQIQRLEIAEQLFVKGYYIDALRSYGLILSEYPLLDEAKVGVFLSDLAEENGEEAQALFDYYQMIKEENKNALDIIEGLVDNLDTSKFYIKKLLENSIENNEQDINGIRYEDFIEHIEARGSFKKAFEDIMFSTQVVIKNKDEFMDFVLQLSKEGFDEMALGYLDASTTLFGNDQDILALYHVVRGI